VLAARTAIVGLGIGDGRLAAGPGSAYYQTMPRTGSIVAWTQAVALTALAWVTLLAPPAGPLIAALAIALHPFSRPTPRDQWRWLGVGLLALLAVMWSAGAGIAGGWLLAAASLAGARWLAPAAAWIGPTWALVCGAGFAVWPQLMAVEGGGWIAPAVLLVAAHQGARRPDRLDADHLEPGPPVRSVRGTVSLRGAVLADRDGLPRTVPLDLDLRAGDSMAVLSDSAADTEALAAFLSGRRAPHRGELAIDGVPVAPGERLVAVIAEGERFVEGDLDDNLAAVADDDLEISARSALYEAFSLAEVAEALAGRRLQADGAPLGPLHRLLVLAARVVGSSYRVLLVVDPMPWVNAVHREIWRSALVRASVGRTAVWITADRELASRAVHVMELRSGALRPHEPE
jgi:hypothetical protein